METTDRSPAVLKVRSGQIIEGAALKISPAAGDGFSTERLNRLDQRLVDLHAGRYRAGFRAVWLPGTRTPFQR